MHAAYAFDLEVSAIDKSLEKKILKNPDIIALLEKDNRLLSSVKLESTLENILYADGYFDAFIRLELDQETHHFHAFIDTGTPYTIGAIEFDEPPSVFTPRYLVKIRRGDLFDAFKLKQAEKNILQFLYGTECRYIKRVKHILKPDPKHKTVKVIFDIGVSPVSVFGKTIFQGQENIHQDVLNQLLTYKQGECYSEREINHTVKNAINANLFKNIYYKIDPNKKDATGIAKVDVIYQLDERKHRTYNYGVGVSDTEALIVSAGNQWRNLFNRAVTLGVQTRLSDRAQTLDFRGTYPSYFGFKKNLMASLEFGRERLIQYNADSITSYIGFEQLPLKTSRFSYGYGIRNNLSEVTRSAVREEEYFMTALPAFVNYDTKDDILRPTKGYRASLSLSPAIDFFNDENFFITNQITGTNFTNMGTIGDPKLNGPSILAFRAHAGSIIGSGLNDLPIIERFYAGGGGSVRGYEFQALGDLQNGQSQGGVSVFESSLEARIGIGQSYGAVLFFDAGNVYEEVLPKFYDDLQFAVGIGARYYSDIIPIRFDIGVPINPRTGRNDDFGFYVGIGESF